MLSKIVYSTYFYKTISKHVGVTNLFNNKFIIVNQFSNIMILNIDIFDFRLVFSIFNKDSTGFIIFIDYTCIN